MYLIDDCPECGKQLSKNRMHCNCGWSASEMEVSPVVDDRCQYGTSEWRCSENGKFGPRGVAGKWYCYDHWYQIVNGRGKY